MEVGDNPQSNSYYNDNSDYQQTNYDNQQWFYAKNKQKMGPYNPSQMIDLYHRNIIKPNTYVICRGMKSWIQFSQSELFKRAEMPESVEVNIPQIINNSQISNLHNKSWINRNIGWIVALVVLLIAYCIKASEVSDITKENEKQASKIEQQKQDISELQASIKDKDATIRKLQMETDTYMGNDTTNTSDFIIPNYVGRNINDVIEEISKYGIKYEIEEIVTDNSDTGTILETYPDAGSNAVLGTIEFKVVHNIEDFKQECVEVTYEELFRYPEKYKDTKIKINAKIDDVESKTFLGFEYGKEIQATCNKEPLDINDDRYVKEPTMRGGDKVTIYGYGDGLSTVSVKERVYQGSLLLGFSYNKTVDTYDIVRVKALYVDVR